MSRLYKYSEVNELEGLLGIEPTTFKTIDYKQLSIEWGLFKKDHLHECELNEKYCDLIALAVATASGRTHSVSFLKSHAKHSGATDKDIKEVEMIAKFIRSGSDFSDDSVEDYNESQDAELNKEICAGW